jgi:Ca2+-binding RTX toxin-like protein
MVAADGGDVVGTAGDDVILVLAPANLRALAGNDTVCLRGSTVDDDGIGTALHGGHGEDSVQIRTTDDQDHLVVSTFEDVDAALGTGGPAGDRFEIYGGTVRGIVTTESPGLLFTVTGRRFVAMRDGVVRVDRRDEGLVVNGFPRVRAVAPMVSLTGQEGDDHLSGKGCRVLLRGGAGNDWLLANPRFAAAPQECDERSTRLLGMGGADRLVGSEFDDVLIGGPGRDSATGKAGADRCDAETQTGCER